MTALSDFAKGIFVDSVASTICNGWTFLFSEEFTGRHTFPGRRE